MTDLKLSAKERKSSMLGGPEEPEYPWGLRVSLDPATMKKLGGPAFNVGETLEIEAKVKVVSLSEGDDGLRAELQIVALDLEDRDESGAEERIYTKR